MAAKAAHTAGPWVHVQKEGPRPTNLLRRHWEIGQSGPPHYGVAIAFGPEEEGIEPPTDANARLIAAAPDLLAAAQTILADLDARIQQAPRGMVPVFRGIADLHAAIAKALGQRAVETAAPMKVAQREGR